MLMGLAMVSVYLLSGITREGAAMILGCILGCALIVEFARLRSPAFNERVVRSWSMIIRRNEVNRMTGVPYYVASAILSIVIFPKPVAALSLLYLAFGDPIASLFGILYGDLSFRFSSGKSLIGTAAGMFTCFMITMIFLSGSYLPISTILTLSVVGGLAGGAAELLPLEVDDNLSIPMVSGFVLWLAYILLGV
jgi:dolichol kinase